MKRILVVFGVAVAVLVSMPTAHSQNVNVYRVGFLRSSSFSTSSPLQKAFRQGLRELGYVEGKNLLIEYRSAEGNRDRIPGLIADLIQLRVDVIVVAGAKVTSAAKRATTKVPIVVASAGDLVGRRLVASLSRPGGNITGSTNVDADLSGKRLELLKETISNFTRVAILSWKGNRGDQEELKETWDAARALNVKIQSFEIKHPNQFQNAFDVMAKNPPAALIITNNSFTFDHRRRIFALAASNRIPTMCGRASYVKAGCLMSYAASRIDSYRRAAYFVDKILKGAKPSELPVQRPTRFDLIINLKAAKLLGIMIPPEVLIRATKVIK